MSASLVTVTETFDESLVSLRLGTHLDVNCLIETQTSPVVISGWRGEL
jgi:hypothetical protein